MSNTNGRDDNGNPVIWGVSHLDGITPVQVKFTADGGILVDQITTIQFDPEIDASVVPNNAKLAKATASTDSSWTVEDKTTRPWVVNASTGAVLVDM